MILRLAYYIYAHTKNYRISRFLAAVMIALSEMVCSMQTQNGFVNSNHTREHINKNRQILDNWESEENKYIKSMTWFIPAFTSPFAGINNILCFIKFFLDTGTNVTIVLLGSVIVTNYCRYLIRKNPEFAYLEKSKIFINPQIDKLPYTDAGIATRCDTAYSLLKFNNTRSKFYFIQDDERLLYPTGVKHSLAEATYRFGFLGITNAECLKEMYIREFVGKAETYFPAPHNMRPMKITPSKRIRRVFFYSRPGDLRNGFTLGMAGLEEIKKRHSEVEIVAAGSAKTFNDHGLGIENFGQVPFNQLPEFYASCDIGIYILLSRHTGVIPFELMASGCAVLTNRRYYQQSYLRHMENCVTFDLTPSSIADAFDTLYCSQEIYERIIINGLNFINTMPTVHEEMNRIHRFMVA